MKYLLLLCVVIAVVIAEEKYTDKYDNLNLDEILSSERLLDGYVNCLMERGKCTREGKELKVHMKDALETGCEKCTEPQKKGASKVIDHLIKNKPKIWNEVATKYDPTGEYRKKHEKLAAEHGIVIPAYVNF